MSYRVYVVADSSGEAVPNGLYFPTRVEAELYAADLYSRWTAVRSTEVREEAESANYTFGSEGLMRRE